MPQAAMTCFAKARRMIFSSGSRSIWAAWLVSRSRPRITWPARRFAGKERVMALPPGLWLNFEDGPAQLGGFPRRGRSLRCEAQAELPRKVNGWRGDKRSLSGVAADGGPRDAIGQAARRWHDSRCA